MLPNVGCDRGGTMLRVAAPPSLPDARPLVDAVLAEAVRRGASDVHVEPMADGYELRLRIDGLLEPTGRLDVAAGRGAVARLMVMAGLLTYRLDVPQEGRVTIAEPAKLELRVAVMPTTHGPRAAVRLPTSAGRPQTLDDLCLPPAVDAGLRGFAAADAGLLIVTGPAGSGKTTTLYALLAHIAATTPGLSLVSLEDPVERDLPGVTQVEVSPFGQLTYERALRSILRQDPQVLMLGEIRDAATATLAVQAALSGHRLACTFHAATAGGAVARLVEMGVEPYQVTSAVYGIVSQRLLRRTTGDGYRGRVAVASFARLDGPARAAVLRRDDAATVDDGLAQQPGHIDLRTAAAQVVSRGITDAAEVRRVLGTV
jgi:general secretion pathway protein E